VSSLTGPAVLGGWIAVVVVGPSSVPA